MPISDATASVPSGRGGFSFYPDPARVERMDSIKHADFRSSVDYIAEEVGVYSSSIASSLFKVSSRLASGEMFSPVAFGTYYSLVDAISDGQLSRADEFAARLASLPERKPGLTIKQIGGPGQGFDDELLVTLMTGNAGFEMSLLSPAGPAALAFEERMAAAFLLMDKALPELGAEVKALAREVFLAESDPSASMQFDGGSHYKLWGAVFLNVRFHPTVESVVEVMAHESAHNLLFGFCNDEPLVRNEDDELYHSPLRKDSRPMDGVYHATFVLARMHYAMNQLLESGLYAPEREQDLIEARERDKQFFLDGYAVVEKSAILTDTGQQLMDGACEYMAQFI